MSDAQIGIAATNQTFMNAFTDAQLLPPNSDYITGYGAITALWQSYIDMGIAEVKLESVDLNDLGDMAIEIGKYQLFAADGSPLDNGKFLVVWKNEGGWKLHWDIWNSSVAPAESGRDQVLGWEDDGG
jgi:ketosteroid isomerase-like protein